MTNDGQGFDNLHCAKFWSGLRKAKNYSRIWLQKRCTRAPIKIHSHIILTNHFTAFNFNNLQQKYDNFKNNKFLNDYFRYLNKLNRLNSFMVYGENSSQSRNISY